MSWRQLCECRAGPPSHPASLLAASLSCLPAVLLSCAPYRGQELETAVRVPRSPPPSPQSYPLLPPRRLPTHPPRRRRYGLHFVHIVWVDGSLDMVKVGLGFRVDGVCMGVALQSVGVRAWVCGEGVRLARCRTWQLAAGALAPQSPATPHSHAPPCMTAQDAHDPNTRHLPLPRPQHLTPSPCTPPRTHTCRSSR